GGLAGKAIAEQIDPTAEEAHWRSNYGSRPYVEQGSSDDDSGPASRYGWETRPKHAGRTFDEAEADLQGGWETAKAKSRLGWDRARHAVRDAWDRVDTPRAADRTRPQKG